MSINTANQTSDSLRYPMNNTFIRYHSCVNTIATVSCAINTCITWRDMQRIQGGGGGRGPVFENIIRTNVPVQGNIVYSQLCIC